MSSMMMKYIRTVSVHKYELPAKILLHLLLLLQGSMAFNLFARYRLGNECKLKLSITRKVLLGNF